MIAKLIRLNEPPETVLALEVKCETHSSSVRALEPIVWIAALSQIPEKQDVLRPVRISEVVLNLHANTSKLLLGK